jgi:hypothetical protein
VNGYIKKDNDGLTDVSFGNVSSVTTLTINGCDGLPSLLGFPVRMIGQFSILYNQNLTSLSGMIRLQQVLYIFNIIGNNALLSFGYVPNLTSLYSFTIEVNTSCRHRVAVVCNSFMLNRMNDRTMEHYKV